jgi:hypothetical protein
MTLAAILEVTLAVALVVEVEVAALPPCSPKLRRGR